MAEKRMKPASVGNVIAGLLAAGLVFEKSEQTCRPMGEPDGLELTPVGAALLMAHNGSTAPLKVALGLTTIPGLFVEDEDAVA